MYSSDSSQLTNHSSTKLAGIGDRAATSSSLASGEMKRRPLRRSQSLHVGTSKTPKRNTVPVSTEIGPEGSRPETAYKPTKLGWKDGHPSEAGTINIDVAPDADEFR